jgi:hypothetical protein
MDINANLQPVNDFVILHRIGEILIGLMGKTLAKSAKYPKEAEIVNEALQSFINRKLKEIYGSPEIPAKEETPVTKEEAMRMVKEAINKVKGKASAAPKQSPPASYVSDTYVNPPETPSVDNYNPHSFINRRMADDSLDSGRGDFSSGQITDLAQRLLKG